jgi:hypothetical protein
MSACAVTRKAFFPHEELRSDTYGYLILPACTDEPSSDEWMTLTASRRETTFRASLSGVVGHAKSKAPELLDLYVAHGVSASACSDTRIYSSDIQLRLVGKNGVVSWGRAPPAAPASTLDRLLDIDLWTGEAWPAHAQTFCFVLQMRPEVQRVELVAAGRVVMTWLRPTQVDVYAKVARDKPLIAITYDDTATPYATATMRIETPHAICHGARIAQRADAGFLRLGGRCWSSWRSHFSRSDEIDPGLDQPDSFHARYGEPAALVVGDLYSRTLYPLWFRASCGGAPID